MISKNLPKKKTSYEKQRKRSEENYKKNDNKLSKLLAELQLYIAKSDILKEKLKETKKKQK